MINYNDITEIAILSPFRAQAANIRRHIGKNGYINEENRNLLAIDTIDKMQGQEREVIIFSLAAGNIDAALCAYILRKLQLFHTVFKVLLS